MTQMSAHCDRPVIGGPSPFLLGFPTPGEGAERGPNARFFWEKVIQRWVLPLHVGAGGSRARRLTWAGNRFKRLAEVGWDEYEGAGWKNAGRALYMQI